MTIRKRDTKSKILKCCLIVREKLASRVDAKALATDTAFPA